MPLMEFHQSEDLISETRPIDEILTLPEIIVKLNPNVVKFTYLKSIWKL